MRMKSELAICVVGLGYVGLPTAVAFYNSGFKVFGIDTNLSKISQLKSGIDPLVDESSHLAIPTESELWGVSTEYSSFISKSDIVIITVPTPTTDDKRPDLSFIESASRCTLQNIDSSRGTTIILESTVYPGVTREVFTRICDEEKLVLGEDLEIAYCPERVSPGDHGKGVSGVARVVGCDNPEKGKMLADLYGEITQEECRYVGPMEVAEAAKMVENVQRDIDIALSNELSKVLSKIDVDVEDVLSAAETKWNFHRHTPGIGVGGHCIPVDPYYYISLAESVGVESLVSKAAREINESMPRHCATEINDIMEARNNPRKVLILGYAYKAQVGDVRETPVKELASKLQEFGNEVFVWDPLVEKGEVPGSIDLVDDPYECVDVGVVILATAHREVMKLNWERLKKIFNCCSPIIYDGRRVLDQSEFQEGGWTYTGVGVPI